MSDGANKIDLSFKEDQREISKQNRLQNPETHSVSLPAELLPIVDLGIKDTGVAKLRGMAYAKGYDLADVFTVAKKRLSELNANTGRMYRYLAAMIDNPRPCDYAARAAQIVRSSVQAAVVTQSVDRRAKYAHKRFAAPGGVVVRIFDGIAEVLRDGAWLANIAGADMRQVYDDIERGVLKECAQ